MAITADLVKELRKRTDAPMMECKKFLEMTDGDIEKAIDKMREAGATKAAKKEGRITAEGLIVIKIADDKKSAVVAEVNCETDFVSRGADLKQFAQQVAETALTHKTDDLAKLATLAIAGGTIEEVRQTLIARIGENINIRRVSFITTTDSITGYLHGERIGVIVSYQGTEQLGKDIAMHIAASNPQVITPEQVSAELIAKEKEIYMVQAAESGKPQEIIEKMVTGRIQKFLNEVSLMGQPFVKNPDITVGKLVKDSNANVHQFVRYEVGEGIEKKVDNFVEEVMAQARGN